MYITQSLLSLSVSRDAKSNWTPTREQTHRYAKLEADFHHYAKTFLRLKRSKSEEDDEEVKETEGTRKEEEEEEETKKEEEEE